MQPERKMFRSVHLRLSSQMPGPLQSFHQGASPSSVSATAEFCNSPEEGLLQLCSPSSQEYPHKIAQPASSMPRRDIPWYRMSDATCLANVPCKNSCRVQGQDTEVSCHGVAMARTEVLSPRHDRILDLSE